MVNQEDKKYQAYQLWLAKEQIYEDFERDYRNQRQALENRFQDYDHTRHQIQRLLDEENEKLVYFVKKQPYLTDTEPIENFYQSSQYLLEDSQDAYQRACAELEWQLDDLEKDFRQQCWKMEDEIAEARRHYDRYND